MITIIQLIIYIYIFYCISNNFSLYLQSPSQGHKTHRSLGEGRYQSQITVNKQQPVSHTHNKQHKNTVHTTEVRGDNSYCRIIY